MTSPATRTEAPPVPDHDHAMVCQGCGASFLAILTDDEPATLDEAWRAVEAVLPEGFGVIVQPFLDDRPDPDPALLYRAYPGKVYVRPGRRGQPDLIDSNSFDVFSPAEGLGPTPAAALQALRDKLVAG